MNVRLFQVYDKVVQGRVGHPIPASNTEHAKRIFKDALPGTDLEKHSVDFVVQSIEVDDSAWVNEFEVVDLLPKYDFKSKKGSKNA